MFWVNLTHLVDIPARSEMICLSRKNVKKKNEMTGIVKIKGQITAKYNVIPTQAWEKVLHNDIALKVLNPTSVQIFHTQNWGIWGNE